MSQELLERKFQQMEQQFGANWWDSTDQSDRA